MNWNDYFDYRDGSLFWNVNRRGSVKAGDKVKNIDGKGYIRVVVNQKFYLAHRIIYEMHNGVIPEGMQIDHIDGNKLNNKPSNLRIASNIINQSNKRMMSNNKSGFTGVFFCNEKGKWIARVRRKYLGSFVTIEAACAARNLAIQQSGEFTDRHGK